MECLRCFEFLGMRLDVGNSSILEYRSKRQCFPELSSSCLLGSCGYPNIGIMRRGLSKPFKRLYLRPTSAVKADVEHLGPETYLGLKIDMLASL
jgi:hypothetical protein